MTCAGDVDLNPSEIIMTKTPRPIRVGAAKALTQGGLVGYLESKDPINAYMP
jgi:hypothetical protein